MTNEGNNKISIVVAMAINHVIGINNTLPWRISADLAHFKSLTMGHHLIMGRKTFDSIGRPLPGRTTVVVTRNQKLKIDGCIVTHSLEEAIRSCGNDDNIFIVGGAELYTLAMPLADIIHLTEIQQEIAGDTFFPAFSNDTWQELARERCQQAVPQPLEYDFVTYGRK